MKREITLTKRRMFATSVVALVLVVTIAVAQKDGNLRRRPDPAVLATEKVKELLLIMDDDRNGTITKEEWVRFMAAEFDRLDKDKRRALDVNEIAPTTLRPRRLPDLGK
jgi:hypothetical protein